MRTEKSTDIEGLEKMLEGADGTKTDKNWKEDKVRWVLDETFSEKDTYEGKTPGIYLNTL